MGNLTVGEKLKIIMDRRHITMTTLAEMSGQSRQNLSNKFSRNNFSEGDIKILSDAMSCEYEIRFTLPDGSEV